MSISYCLKASSDNWPYHYGSHTTMILYVTHVRMFQVYWTKIIVKCTQINVGYFEMNILFTFLCLEHSVKNAVTIVKVLK